jgi:hypothetical protein
VRTFSVVDIVEACEALGVQDAVVDAVTAQLFDVERLPASRLQQSLRSAGLANSDVLRVRKQLVRRGVCVSRGRFHRCDA